MPYASFPYADHALRLIGVDPNTPAEPTDAHIDLLISAANTIRTMVHEMENLEDIGGFITYEEEKARESRMIKTDDTGEEEK